MAPRSFVTTVGFIILIAGIYCPLISSLGLVKWSLLDLNKTFALILQAFAMCGIIFNFKKQGALKKFSKLNAWIALVLVILVFVAVKMKVNTAFSFIPFPKLSHTLSDLIHYHWGWYLLFAGPVLALLGNRKKESLHPSTP